MANKTVVITGCTSGIGYETALGLAKQGYNLILLGRQEALLTALKMQLHEIDPSIRIEYYVCDFAKLSQVVAIAKLIAKAYPAIDILINNAAIWELKKKTIEGGFEQTWVVNYFAPFLLTYHLMPALLRTAKTTKDVRIINLSSEAHRRGSIDMNFSSFSWLGTYGSTKFANMLHTFKLARDLEKTGITVNCVHPGVVATKLWRQLPKAFSWLFNKFLISPEAGAATTLALATVADLKQSGQYYSNLKVATPVMKARDVQLQESLYAQTLRVLSKYLN